MLGKLTFQKENLIDIYDEMLPIFISHYKEIAHYKDIPLSPDIEQYYRMEKNGITHIFTAREERNLIGYGIFNIRYNLHYKDSLQAWQDILYISKEKRGFGKDFIKWCDLQLKNMGVQVINQHIKVAHNWGKILENMGYELQDLQYSKRLDKGV